MELLSALFERIRTMKSYISGNSNGTSWNAKERDWNKASFGITKNHGGHIKAAYGCSLGGSFIGLLVQRQNIHIDNAILGSSDLDQYAVWKAKIICKIAIPLLHKIVSTGEYPKILRKSVEKKRTPYRDKFTEKFGIGKGGLPFIKKESIYNQFYTDLITPLENNISVPRTTIHCFFAKKMRMQYLSWCGT